MCHDITDANSVVKPNFQCPNHCTLKTLSNETSFEIQANGNLTLKTAWKNLAQVHDYCASYQCMNFSIGWSASIEACLCVKEQELNKLNKTKDDSMTRCCPSSLTKKDGNSLHCMNKPNERTCSTGDMKTLNYEKVENSGNV